MVLEGFPADRFATRRHQPALGLGGYSDDGNEDCNQDARDGGVTDVGDLFKGSGKGKLDKKGRMRRLKKANLWHTAGSRGTK